MTLTCALVGCGDASTPPPKVGVKYWTVSGIGGPIQVRSLPPASKVVVDFDEWLNSESISKARVYQITLCGASNQTAFTVEVRREDTPLGRPEHTYVSFIYNDPTNGTYSLRWDRLGRHDAEFLRLGEKPKKAWLELNRQGSEGNVPKLDIVAFEDVELGGGVIAHPGKKRTVRE